MYIAGFHIEEGGRKLGFSPPPKDLSFAQVQNFKKSVIFKISQIYIRLETTTFGK